MIKVEVICKVLKINILFLVLVVNSFTETFGQEVIWNIQIDSIIALGSPKLRDLNKDGILDIVLTGGIENQATPYGVMAFDGNNGQLLWSKYARNQLYTTPIFFDINADGIEDVFVGGRDAQFYALDGLDGTLIWEFWSDTDGRAIEADWFNFYSPKWIDDLDDDGIPELMVTNGGNAALGPTNKNREPGYLMILSGQDGEIMSMIPMPDGKETYCSPLVISMNDIDYVYWGSGGETVEGHFYTATLEDIIQENINGIYTIQEDLEKGFIAVPSFADMNNDGVLDIISPALNEALLLIDGRTHEVLWSVENVNAENYISPTIGQFVGDDTPDVFHISLNGNFPLYQSGQLQIIDGRTGEIEWQQSAKSFQMSSALALDWDNDGDDEILLIENFDADTSNNIHFQNRWLLINPEQETTTLIGVPRDGINLYSVPQLEDIDGNGKLDLIYTYSNNTSNWYAPAGIAVERMELDFTRNSIAWSGYFGSQNDGVYYNPVYIEFILSENIVELYPSPTSGKLTIDKPFYTEVKSMTIYDNTGKMIRSIDVNSNELDISDLTSGIYVLSWLADGNVESKVILKF